MENFALLFQGFSVALLPQNILAALAGAFMGIVVGAMPGIGSLAGCSLLLPLTFHMNPTTGIIMLAGIRERIEGNDVPYNFQGSPIVLITSGLMAIAFFGFSGLI